MSGILGQVGNLEVHVGLGGDRLPLELQHHDDAVLEHDDVGPARLARQFVLEDGGVGARGVVGGDQLATFALQPGDGVVPGADLLGAGGSDGPVRKSRDRRRRAP